MLCLRPSTWSVIRAIPYQTCLHGHTYSRKGSDEQRPVPIPSARIEPDATSDIPSALRRRRSKTDISTSYEYTTRIRPTSAFAPLSADVAHARFRAIKYDYLRGGEGLFTMPPLDMLTRIAMTGPILVKKGGVLEEVGRMHSARRMERGWVEGVVRAFFRCDSTNSRFIPFPPIHNRIPLCSPYPFSNLSKPHIISSRTYTETIEKQRRHCRR